MAGVTRSEKRKRDDDVLSVIRDAVEQLNSTEADRSLSKAVNTLLELAKVEGNVHLIVESGAVQALVRCVQEHEVEEASAFTLGLLAIKPDYQELIAEAGALPHLIALLKRHKHDQNTPEVNAAIRKAAYAIRHLSDENVYIKHFVRAEGGIPPLVELLKSIDVNMMRSAARTLRTLASKNDENKTQIMNCNALPTLVLMLESENADMNYEAVGVIGALAQSSTNIRNEVLLAGALQPVIKLLSSTYPRTQREAATLIGHFAVDRDCKAHIAQRGAIGPLVEMLQSPDDMLKEVSSFALRRLAHDMDAHNQAGIAHAGGIGPLIKLLDSTNGVVKCNSVIALYELASSEDIVDDFIRFDGVQKLIEGDFDVSTQYYVEKTFERLEKSVRVERVLNRLLNLMCTSDKTSQRQISLALAMFCSSENQKKVFIENDGIGILMELLQSPQSKIRRYCCAALCILDEKATSLSLVDTSSSSLISQAYLVEQYVNSPTHSDVTFLVEGKRFYAHKTRLFASSDVFRAMLDGGYKEKDAKEIEIANIRSEAFALLMRYIHTGSLEELNPRIVPDLFIAADQYLIDDLKCLCENIMVQNISADNIESIYDFSDESNAVSLRNACILFVLKNFQQLDSKPWYRSLVMRILPDIKDYFVKRLVQTLPP